MLKAAFICCFFDVKILLLILMSMSKAWIEAKLTYKDNFWNGFNDATLLIFEKKFSTLDPSRLELKDECKEMSLLLLSRITPLNPTPLSVGNQGVTKYKSEIQMYKKSW